MVARERDNANRAATMMPLSADLKMSPAGHGRDSARLSGVRFLARISEKAAC